MAKKFAWSYSALDGFHLCPKKHYFEKVYKKYPFQPNPATEYGKDLHKAFELYVMNGKALPLDMKHHQPFLDKLKALGDEVLGEQKLALTRDFEPTGWFDDDVWCRGIIDVSVIKGNSAIICDYKSGKPVDGFGQVDMQAAMLSVFMPQIKYFVTGFYYTKQKKMVKHTIEKKDMPDVWASFQPRVTLMEEMIAAEKFPARENFLCKNYCPVKECANCGGS